MEKKEKRLLNTEGKKATGAEVKQTEDSKDMEAEDNTNMVWDRHPDTTWKASERELLSRLLAAFGNAGVKK